MAKLDQYHIIWLEGADCDGCTISALGDTSEGSVEELLTGRVAGVPPIRLFHPIFSLESRDAFVGNLVRAERGELAPYGMVVESSFPREEWADGGFYSGLGEAHGRPITMVEWLGRLAPRAQFIVAFGDCAVWGGPHSLVPDPAGAMGTAMHLGVDYRSTLGLPVINLPGCAAPAVLVKTLATILRWVQDEGPPLELDETNRPRFAYEGVWKGAFGVWRG